MFPKLKCCIFVVKIGKYYSGLGWQICELFCGKRGRGFATITSRAKTHLQRKPAGGGLWSGKSYPVERCVTLLVRGVFSSSLGGCMTPRVRGGFSPPWGCVCPLGSGVYFTLLGGVSDPSWVRGCIFPSLRGVAPSPGSGAYFRLLGGVLVLWVRGAFSPPLGGCLTPQVRGVYFPLLGGALALWVRGVFSPS